MLSAATTTIKMTVPTEAMPPGSNGVPSKPPGPEGVRASSPVSPSSLSSRRTTTPPTALGQHEQEGGNKADDLLFLQQDKAAFDLLLPPWQLWADNDAAADPLLLQASGPRASA